MLIGKEERREGEKREVGREAGGRKERRKGREGRERKEEWRREEGREEGLVDEGGRGGQLRSPDCAGTDITIVLTLCCDIQRVISLRQSCPWTFAVIQEIGHVDRTPPCPVMRMKTPCVRGHLHGHTAGMRKGQNQDQRHLLLSYALAWDLGQMTAMLKDVSDGDHDVTFFIWLR